MDDLNQRAAKATEPATLEQSIMDSRVSKNEREWWAQREITRLRGENDRLKSFALAHELEDARERIAALEAENERLVARNGFLEEFCRAKTEVIVARDVRIAVLEAELKAKQTELEAWFSIFGTQQLSHASARLEAAENKVQRLEAELAKARKDEQKTIEDFTATCNNLRSRLAERDKRIEKLEDLGRIVLDWLQCDLYNHGPGPMGGFQSRVDVVEAALAEDK